MCNFFRFSITIVGLSFAISLNAEEQTIKSTEVKTEQKQPAQKAAPTPRSPAAKNLAAAVETLKSAKNELTTVIEQARQQGTAVDTRAIEVMTEFIRLQEKIETESKKH